MLEREQLCVQIRDQFLHLEIKVSEPRHRDPWEKSEQTRALD